MDDIVVITKDEYNHLKKNATACHRPNPNDVTPKSQLLQTVPTAKTTTVLDDIAGCHECCRKLPSQQSQSVKKQDIAHILKTLNMPNKESGEQNGFNAKSTLPVACLNPEVDDVYHGGCMHIWMHEPGYTYLAESCEYAKALKREQKNRVMGP